MASSPQRLAVLKLLSPDAVLKGRCVRASWQILLLGAAIAEDERDSERHELHSAFYLGLSQRHVGSPAAGDHEYRTWQGHGRCVSVGSGACGPPSLVQMHFWGRECYTAAAACGEARGRQSRCVCQTGCGCPTLPDCCCQRSQTAPYPYASPPMASQSLPYPGALARQAPGSYYRGYTQNYPPAAHCSPMYSITYPDYTPKSDLNQQYPRQAQPPPCTPRQVPPPVAPADRDSALQPDGGDTAHLRPRRSVAGRVQPSSPRHLPCHGANNNSAPPSSRCAPSCTCRPSPRECRACGPGGNRSSFSLRNWASRPAAGHATRVPSRSSSFSNRRGGVVPSSSDDDGALSDTYLAVRINGRRQAAPGYLSDRENGGERVSWAPDVMPGSPRSRQSRVRRSSDSTVRPSEQRGGGISGYESEGEQPTVWGLGGPGDQPRAWGLNLGRAGGVEPQHARFLLDYGFTKVMSGRLSHGVGQAGPAICGG
ncbi:hypothetical protein C7M84_005118 [Penaeus vannamei]|uniref:Uncharacterized protein n=1 Tax=Penaeus vannamei TaxID=6689 RepID=A0A423TIK8_PENVA|nr:hypothetical protein C7M84_005118 [Penaeus vannamei]